MHREFVVSIFISSLFAAPTPILTSIPYFLDKGRHPIQAVAVDPAGNIYIAGAASGPIPLVNTLPQKFCCTFVAKFDPTGTKLIYSTYLAEDGKDSVAGIAVDRDGNAYIAGTTRFSSGSGGGPPPRDGNAFVKKLNPTGSALLYTRYIGGDTPASGIAVDTNGNAYIVGVGIGADFPSVHPLPVQPSVKSLYVTNDSGRTWRAINNGLGVNATNVNSLAVDSTRPSTLYAATSGGLYKSTDAGANWTLLRASAEIGINVVVDPRHPSTVYFTYKFGINMYLARSTDAGATWSNISDNFPVQSFPDPVSIIGAFAIDPGDSNVLWGIVIPNRFSTVIKSTDSGDHWQTVYRFPPDLLQFTTLTGKKLLIDPKNSSRLYACCLSVGGGVYRSNDGGKSWIQGAPGPLAGSAGIVSPWLDPRDASVLYGDWSSGLQRSTDAGMTWAEVPLPPGLAPTGYEPGGLAVDASGTVYLLNDSGYLLNSSNNGASWAKISGPWLPVAGILAIDPTSSSTMYVSSGASGLLVPTPAQHAFVAKLDASGAIQWATLLGGSSGEEARAVAVDSAGNAYVAGRTNSDDFPTVNPFQAVRGTNTLFRTSSAFVTKISADGSSILYSSFLGGTGDDAGNAIAVDAAGNAYIAGGTVGGVFPVVAPFAPQPVSPRAASYVAKVDPAGSKLVYSTLLTGSLGFPNDQVNTIAVDPQGRAIVAGVTVDLRFPLVNPIQPTFSLASSFVAILSASGNSLDFSTYLGDLDDDINSLALAPGGALWIAGNSGLARIDFQTPSAQPGVPLVFSVQNAASFRPGDVVAPGEIVTLMGQELAPAAQAAAYGSLPRTMQGVSVLIAGVAAPLFFVSPGQINFQVPVEIPLGSGPLVVQRGTQMSVVRTVDIVAYSPGLFEATADLRGTPVVVHVNDYSLVTEQNPAHLGEYLAAFCTGLGPTNPPAISGEPAAAAARITATISAELETGLVSPVTYAGLAPGWIGLYQINFKVNENETPGRKQLFFSIGFGASTNQAPIWVQ